jgi:hypothetical protein
MGPLRSAPLVRPYFGNRDAAFSGHRVKQVDPAVFLEDCWIAELVDLPVGGAAHRWGERRAGAFPRALGPQHFSGRAFLPALPVAGEVYAAKQNSFRRLADLCPEHKQFIAALQDG